MASKSGSFALSYPLSRQTGNGMADRGAKKGPPQVLRFSFSTFHLNGPNSQN
jgi:hypothetical protein